MRAKTGITICSSLTGLACLLYTDISLNIESTRMVGLLCTEIKYHKIISEPSGGVKWHFLMNALFFFTILAFLEIIST